VACKLLPLLKAILPMNQFEFIALDRKSGSMPRFNS
jgi:hypothetical protein